MQGLGLYRDELKKRRENAETLREIAEVEKEIEAFNSELKKLESQTNKFDLYKKDLEEKYKASTNLTEKSEIARKLRGL